MKKIFYLLFLVSIIGTARAQELKQIDDCSMLFIYNYRFYEEHKNPESVKSFEMILEVGNLYSKFYNPNLGYRDSLIALHAEAPPEMALVVFSQLRGFSFHSFCDYYIFKNYPSSGTTTFFANLAFGDAHKVEEKLEFNWKIDNDATRVIFGMNCKKATCRYAGRDYEAWFAPEIPISDGPYKFSGLPGLIVLLQDSDKEHVFELREIKNVNKPMYMYIFERTYIKTSAKGYTKALEASKVPLIESFNTTISDNPAAIPNAIAKLRKRNNFIERY